MNIDNIMTYSKTIKPIDGIFSQKPTEYRTIKQWLDYGYKIKEECLKNGGAYFAMKNEPKGFKYYSKVEVEPMVDSERKYYELKYNHRNWTSQKQSNNTNSKFENNKVMGNFSKNNAFQQANIKSSFINQNAMINRIPYNPKDLNDKIALFINVETTGENGKGRPKYGEEVLAISILRGNFITRDAKIIYNKNFKPIHHTEWKVSEVFHGISPKDVENCPTFEDEKRHIQNAIDLGEIVMSYGDENFKILEECGVQIPIKSRFDVKEMFVKHHPELKNFSFSNFLKIYANEKIAEDWNNEKSQPSKKLCEYKTFMNFVATIRQYQTIMNELHQSKLQYLNVPKQGEELNSYER